MCVLLNLLGLISMLTLPVSHFSLYLLVGFPFAFHLAVYERMLLFVTCHHQKISLLYKYTLVLLFWFKQQPFIFYCTALPLLLVYSVPTTVQALIIKKDELFCPQLMKSVS